MASLVKSGQITEEEAYIKTISDPSVIFEGPLLLVSDKGDYVGNFTARISVNVTCPARGCANLKPGDSGEIASPSKE